MRLFLPAVFAGGWRLSSGHDPAALDVVDGRGRFAEHGPHYSRRTPGSKSFTGIGREVVLLHESGAAVWAVVHQRTPVAPGTGSSRGRTGTTDSRARFVWRNMLFRRLPGCSDLASDLIRTATEATGRAWVDRYGELPTVPLRTEIDVRAVKSTNPGCCYLLAGWTRGETKRGKLFLYAPPMETP